MMFPTVSFCLKRGRYYPVNELAAWLCEFAMDGAYNRGMRCITGKQKEILEQMGLFNVEVI